MSERKVIVIVIGVAGDVFHHFEEGWEVDAFGVGDAFCLKDDKSLELSLIGVELEVLSFPDKALALLVYRVAIRIGLREQRLVESVAYL